MKKHKYNSNTKHLVQQRHLLGYTLVEAAIVITILAIIGVGGLQLIANKNDKENTATTITRIAKIGAALQTYAAKNGALPCPADPRIGSGDANFAKATAYDSSTHTCHNSDLVYNTGLVPVRTLQLADTYLNDGWGSRFTYRISTNAGSSIDFKENNLFNGSIQITDLDGKSITLNATETFHDNGAAYILISYGQNNRKNQAFFSGVWNGSTVSPNPDGITSTAPGTKGEKANADHNRARYVQNKKLGTFDDIVFFQRRSDLFTFKRHEGIVGIPSDLCNMAKTVLRGANDANLNATSAGADVQLAANRIFDSCLASPNCKNINQSVATFFGLPEVKISTAFVSYYSKSIRLDNGNIVVAWLQISGGWSAFYQIYDSNLNTIAGPTSVSGPVADSSNSSIDIAHLGGNRWAITWIDTSQGFYSRDPYGAIFNNTTMTSGTIFPINSDYATNSGGPTSYVRVTTFGDTAGAPDPTQPILFIFYDSGRGKSFGKLYQDDGTEITPDPSLIGVNSALGNEFPIYQSSSAPVYFGSTTGTTLIAGGKVLFIDPWSSLSAGVYNSSGIKTGSFLYNLLSSLSSFYISPFAIANIDSARQAYIYAAGGNSSDIYLEIRNISGTLLAGPTIINSTTNYRQSQPRITKSADNDGKFLITWTNYDTSDYPTGIYAKVITIKANNSITIPENDLAVSTNSTTNSTAYMNSEHATAFSGGKYFVTWKYLNDIKGRYIGAPAVCK